MSIVIYTEGENPGKGIYECIKCNQLIELDENSAKLPACPKCGKSYWVKTEESEFCSNLEIP